MKRFFSFCVIFSALASLAWGQSGKDTYYQTGSYTYSDISLPFWQLEIFPEKEGRPALVVQLHGGTARGDDNTAQLNADAVDSVEHGAPLPARLQGDVNEDGVVDVADVSALINIILQRP